MKIIKRCRYLSNFFIIIIIEQMARKPLVIAFAILLMTSGFLCFFFQREWFFDYGVKTKGEKKRGARAKRERSLPLFFGGTDLMYPC